MISKIRYLLTDKLIVNFLHIFGGDTIASILSIFSISFITKGIGLEKYGFIVLIQGIVSLIDGVFNFQSWQGVIKFFPEVKENRARLRALLKFSYILDIITAMIAFLIILFSSFFIGKFYDFDRGEIYLLIFFSTYIIFNIQGTPIGILRSFNRFDYLRNQRVVVAFVNFLMLGIGFFYKFGVLYFIAIYLFTNILNAILLNYFAYKELKRRKLSGIWREKFQFDREFFKFTCLTNINSSLDIPVQYFDNLLVGKILSLEQLGVYKVCKTIAVVLDKIGAPLYQILYPYFCDKIIEKKYGEIVRKSLKISGLLGILCLTIILGMNVIGIEILAKFFSQGLKNYILELNIYLLMKSLATISIVVHPLFLAMGYIKNETKVIFVSNVVYLVFLLILIRYFSLIGVIVAYGIQVSLIVLMKGFIILRENKNRN